jgi:hypothetical protein
MVLPAIKFRPSMFSSSLIIISSFLTVSTFMNVSKSILFPSCIYCPMECRSVVKSTAAGKIPFPSFPSLSPYSCFHHSEK